MVADRKRKRWVAAFPELCRRDVRRVSRLHFYSVHCKKVDKFDVIANYSVKDRGIQIALTALR